MAVDDFVSCPYASSERVELWRLDAAPWASAAANCESSAEAILMRKRRWTNCQKRYSKECGLAA